MDKTSEIQIWSVDRGKQLYAVPLKGEMSRGIAISPDDREVIVGDYSEIVARDIRTGARKWRREAREWAYSPDGTQLAVVRHTIAVELLGAATRRGLFKVHATRPWATSHAEIHSPEVLGFSDDGSKLFMGNGGAQPSTQNCGIPWPSQYSEPTIAVGSPVKSPSSLRSQTSTEVAAPSGFWSR